MISSAFAADEININTITGINFFNLAYPYFVMPEVFNRASMFFVSGFPLNDCGNDIFIILCANLSPYLFH